MKKPLGDLAFDSEATGESLLIRQDGEVIAALLTGADFASYREWIRSRSWTMIEETRERNAHLTPEEIDAEVDRIVAQVRGKTRASRAAS